MPMISRVNIHQVHQATIVKVTMRTIMNAMTMGATRRIILLNPLTLIPLITKTTTVTPANL